MWTVFQRNGFLQKFVNIVQLFHDGMTGRVLAGGDVTGPFEISIGVKQGCVVAPVLFNTFFTRMMSLATQHLEKGAYIRYRLDSFLLDLRRIPLRKHFFAEDCALVVREVSFLQLTLKSVSLISQSALRKLKFCSKLHQAVITLHQLSPSIVPS